MARLAAGSAELLIELLLKKNHQNWVAIVTRLKELWSVLHERLRQ